MKIQSKNLKIAKILVLIFVITVIAEASLIYVYNPYEGVKCPNCNSTNTEYWMDDGPDITYECFNCGAYFYEDGYIFLYNEDINKKYNENLEHNNKTINNISIN
jgi:Zn ribbon nucleic-acid-binding protein